MTFHGPFASKSLAADVTFKWFFSYKQQIYMYTDIKNDRIVKNQLEIIYKKSPYIELITFDVGI